MSSVQYNPYVMISEVITYITSFPRICFNSWKIRNSFILNGKSLYYVNIFVGWKFVEGLVNSQNVNYIISSQLV